MNEFQYIRNVFANIEKEMYGMTEVVKLCLVALYTRGHVLLEGNPGVGKTDLVRTLTESLGFGNNDQKDERWGRIQFTPDLMPADITGTRLPVGGGEFKFTKGPIFTWLLLADEINRATPKTQSAMLEAMAERQVTVLGDKHRITQTTVLDGNQRVESPFTVFATQNPIDQEGTYDLPEAQSDRFRFKVRVDVPGGDVLARIMRKTAGALATNERREPETGERPATTSEADALAYFDRLSRQIQKIMPMGTVQQHIINMVLASNGRFGELASVKPRARRKLEDFVKEYLSFGLGPRAATALMLGAKGYCAIELLREQGRDTWPDHGTTGYETDVGLFKVALPVLRHRLKLRLGWSAVRDAQSIEDTQDGLLCEFVIHSAPAESGYAANVERDLAKR